MRRRWRHVAFRRSRDISTLMRRYAAMMMLPSREQRAPATLPIFSICTPMPRQPAQRRRDKGFRCRRRDACQAPIDVSR